MSAIIKIYRWTGSGPASTDVTLTNTRIDASDNNSVNSFANPIIIPATATTAYSFWASYRMHCTTAPDVSLSNFKIYSDGVNSLGTGVGLNIGLATSYMQATGGGGTGDELNTTNYPSLTGAPASFFSYTSGSPLPLGASTTVTGDFGNFVVLQYTADDTAIGGPTPVLEKLTLQYDEL